MARRVADPRLRSRTSRRDLPASHVPYWIWLSRGCHLGYRKGAKGGMWLAKWSCPGNDSLRRQTVLGPADDIFDANGVTVLAFEQAQAKARAWFEQAHEDGTGEVVSVAPRTVGEVVKVYLEDCERRGLTSLDRMKDNLNAHVLPVFEKLEVSKLTRRRVEDWLQELANRPRKSKVGEKKEPREETAPLSGDELRARKATANRIWTDFRAALNHAVDRELVVDDSGWRKVKPFKGVDEARIRFLNPQEQVRLVNACPPDFRRLVQGALFTGARCGELSRLEARDFNPTAGTVLVAKGKGRDGGKPRHIVLTPEGLEFFMEAVAGLAPTDILFTREAHENRNRHSPKVVREWRTSEQFRFMEEACGKAGIESLTFHELRHTYASGLVNAGVPLAFVAEQLGHSSTRMVEKHYGHLCPSAKAEAIRKLAPKLGIHESGKIRMLGA